MEMLGYKEELTHLMVMWSSAMQDDGSECDDEWSLNEARIVCGQLNYNPEGMFYLVQHLYNEYIPYTRKV